MAAPASQTLPDGSFREKYFYEGGEKYTHCVYDGHAVARDAVLTPNPGDIWFGPHESGEHNIWVFGSLDGDHKHVFKRTLSLQWSRVPRDTDPYDVNRRFHFPTNVQLKGSRFLRWKAVSLDGFSWITRATASAESGEFSSPKRRLLTSILTFESRSSSG